jgi:hypothetical protein
MFGVGPILVNPRFLLAHRYDVNSVWFGCFHCLRNSSTEDWYPELSNRYVSGLVVHKFLSSGDIRSVGTSDRFRYPLSVDGGQSTPQVTRSKPFLITASSYLKILFRRFLLVLLVPPGENGRYLKP